jgi:16S rRNA (uracil1498-N3)-methyltransferase
MAIPRIFQAIPLAIDTVVPLNVQASHHLARVLRAAIHDQVTIFNGEGGEYRAIISHIDKKTVTLRVNEFLAIDNESPLDLYLAQGISRGEKMDYTIQKAVELGVKKIIPLFTERCNVKLDDDRREKRIQHWQSIIISACEQCGRNRIPELVTPQSLGHWLPKIDAEWRFVLSPHHAGRLSEQAIPAESRVVLLIGPEGGLSEMEVGQVSSQGFQPLNLGPRILRTETAAVAAITALQCYFGDMAS